MKAQEPIKHLMPPSTVNGILVGEVTFRATSRVITYREAESVTAKGKVEPVQVWEAVEARSRLGSDLTGPGRAPLVGRTHELEVLRDSLARVRRDRSPPTHSAAAEHRSRRAEAHRTRGRTCMARPDGKPLPPSTFYKQWMALRRRAGVRAVSFHALRHTAATLAIEGGQPLQAVAKMLGHSTVTTTMKLYVHATDASAEALADFIDYQYGPRLRIVPAAEMDAKWTPENEIADTAREKACRERESNLPACVRPSDLACL